MNVGDYQQMILNEISTVLDHIDEKQTKAFVHAIHKAKRIYITGQGRSGLVVKTFGQRLMQMGFEVHLADEISAPAISRGDILIACSGTGKTQLTNYMAKKATGIKAKVIVLTADAHSPIAKQAKHIVTMPVRVNASQSTGTKSRQPIRSLFEQSLLIFLDAVIIELISKLSIPKGKLERRHGNLE